MSTFALPTHPLMEGSTPHRPRGRIRLTYVIGDMTRGGAQSLLWEVLQVLDPARFEVTVICLFGTSLHLIPPHVRLIEVGLTSPRYYRQWKSYRMLADVLKRHECDILHTHLHAGDILGLSVAYFNSIPLTYSTVHNTVEWPRDRFSIRATAEDFFLRRATRVIAVSEALRTFIIDKRHCPAWKIIALRNGLNFAPFVSAHSYRSSVRQALGISDSAMVVMCSAQFRPEKRHDLLLAAFEHVLSQQPDACLLLVGSGGALRDRITEWIREKKRERNIFMLSATREEVAQYCGASDIFSMHSEFEGQPLALLEAMVSGLPVAIPDRPELLECVRHNVDGIVFPFSNVQAHANAILSLWSSIGAGDRWWRGTTSYIEREFSIEKHVRSLEDLYLRDFSRRHPFTVS